MPIEKIGDSLSSLSPIWRWHTGVNPEGTADVVQGANDILAHHSVVMYKGKKDEGGCLKNLEWNQVCC